jgi:hypothetical protein
MLRAAVRTHAHSFLFGVPARMAFAKETSYKLLRIPRKFLQTAVRLASYSVCDGWRSARLKQLGWRDRILY